MQKWYTCIGSVQPTLESLIDVSTQLFILSLFSVRLLHCCISSEACYIRCPYKNEMGVGVIHHY